MRLYHHTDPAYLPSIMEVGLLSRPWGGGGDPVLSVVCTTDPSRVPKHSKKLHHYRSWVKANDAMIVDEFGNGRCNDAGKIWTTAGHLKDCLSSMSRWYVYFGDISPKKITPA